jgi:hypothetical protein
VRTIAVGTKRDPGTAGEEAVYCLECDIVRLRQEHKQLRETLNVLFELLEEYAPSWYREEYREVAVAAVSGTSDGVRRTDSPITG